MTCYVVLYCFSPYLNRLVHNLSQKSYKQLLLLWGFFFVFAPTILFFEIQNDTGKGIINVTLAYLIGQYLKTYGLPENMKRHSGNLVRQPCRYFYTEFPAYSNEWKYHTEIRPR